jgi:hypothetical protein
MEGRMRIGKVVDVDPDGQMSIHMYDTPDLAADSNSNTHWTHSWYPLYLAPDSGLVARKPDNVTEEFVPVITVIQPGDVFDVPFSLNAANKLKMQQKTVLSNWQEQH